MVQIIALALGCLFIRLMFPENALVGVAVDLQHRCALCSLLNDVVTGDGDILACSEASRALSLVWSRMAPGRFVAVDPWWATRGQTRSMPDSCAQGRCCRAAVTSAQLLEEVGVICAPQRLHDSPLGRCFQQSASA